MSIAQRLLWLHVALFGKKYLEFPVLGRAYMHTGVVLSFFTHMREELARYAGKDLLVDDRLGSARAGRARAACLHDPLDERRRAGKRQLVHVVHAPRDLVELYRHDPRQRFVRERAERQDVAPAHERGLEVRDERRFDRFDHLLVRRRLRRRIQLTDDIRGEVRRHDDHGIAEIDLAAFAVAHESLVEHLVEHVHDLEVRFFNFVK